jgi:hypothetical protein
MMAVPRRADRAADQEADTQVNGKLELEESSEPESEAQSEPETTLLPVLADEAADLATPALPAPNPLVKPDPGLYAVLGLDPSASDVQIQTTYRRMAARVLGGSGDNQALRQLNIAHEVLGNPVRRAEYDRLRVSQSLVSGTPTPIRPGAKTTARITKRRRPRHAVIPRYAGLGDVVVVLVVVGLAVVAGALLIPRLSINLSALNALQAVMPLSNTTRRVIDVTVTAVPTVQATATPLPSVSARYASSTVSVSDPNPAQNSNESVQVRIRRDGQAVPSSDVWATVTYRTTEERWPSTGAVKTDQTGAATITFNIGAATPNYPVTVHVFTEAEDQQLSWSTTFTPR